jgi:acetylornithine deacetylase/succinyl-diaminopimelate desuccinylase-like protein
MSLAEIVEHPAWMRMMRTIHEQREWLDRTQIELTEISAPTFHESARAEFIAAQCRSLGIRMVRMDSAGNVLAEKPGAINGLVVIAAHLDTVVQPGVPITVKRVNGRLCAPGISDNGAGLAAVLGLIGAIEKSAVVTDRSLLFAATVGEEGEGDLYGMRHLFSQPELCRRSEGVFVLDGSSTSHITVAGIGSRRFQVEIKGPGGHSWSDFGRVNPIHVLSNAIAELSRIPLPENPRTSLNVGMIHGGTAVNAIPESAWMKVDIRSMRAEEIERLTEATEAAIKAALRQENQRATGKLDATITTLGNRPVAELPETARILATMQEVDRYLGNRSRLERSSTDANIPLSLGIEAIATGGGGSSGDVHTLQEWFDPRGREFGLKRLLLAILMTAGMVDEIET